MTGKSQTMIKTYSTLIATLFAVGGGMLTVLLYEGCALAAQQKSFSTAGAAAEALLSAAQAGDIAALNRMLRHLLPAARRQRRDQPGRPAQFQRNEDCAKLRLDSGRRLGSVSYNLHGRLHSGWV